MKVKYCMKIKENYDRFDKIRIEMSEYTNNFTLFLNIIFCKKCRIESLY